LQPLQQPHRPNVHLKTSNEDRLAKYTSNIVVIRDHISNCKNELSIIYLTARQNAQIEIEKSLNDNQITLPQEIYNSHVQKSAQIILSIETIIEQNRVLLQEYICKIEELVN
jgi:hypothetical protein